MDKKRVRNAVTELLKAIGENPHRQGLRETPSRIAELLQEILSGNRKDPKDILKVSHSIEHDEMVIVKNIPFYSMCEHHFLPFFGKCHVAYIPEDDNVVGIGKLTEIVDVMSKKLQLQERLTTEIANIIMQCLNPKGVAVVIEARHLCIEMRGLKDSRTEIVTSAVRGIFRKDIKTREEFLKLIK